MTTAIDNSLVTRIAIAATEPPESAACEPKSTEEQRALAYIHRQIGLPSFVEFVQTRRFHHFTGAHTRSEVNRYAEEWGCVLNVKDGGTFHMANGETACGAARRAVAKYMEEQAAITEAAEKEMEDAERFDGME